MWNVGGGDLIGEPLGLDVPTEIITGGLFYDPSAGSFGLFALFYLLFTKFFPIISIWEIREGRESSLKEVEERIASYLPGEFEEKT